MAVSQQHPFRIHEERRPASHIHQSVFARALWFTSAKRLSIKKDDRPAAKIRGEFADRYARHRRRNPLHDRNRRRFLLLKFHDRLIRLLLAKRFPR